MFELAVYAGSAVAFLVWLYFGAPGVPLLVSAVQALGAKVKGWFQK
jgi:hypothetical protein